MATEVNNHKKEVLIALFFVFAIGIGIGIFSSNLSFSGGNSVTTKLVAVDDNGNGVSADVVATVKKGTGLILVNINNAVADIDTQRSARKAASVASQITGLSLAEIDVSYDIKTSAYKVSGESAGTAMTLATIAAITNKTLRNDVAVTGGINEDGTVSMVGSIPEKASAAKAIGMNVLLIPIGGNIPTLEYQRVKKCSTYDDKEFCDISYSDKINAGGVIEMKEISNIKEALEYSLK
ncbi:MAG: S16 family serine protease [Candidatus Nanoarchaeia archaeon]|nr:S16 family serine protease [Candidatus Nanoarchaeia archaeon]